MKGIRKLTAIGLSLLLAIPGAGWFHAQAQSQTQQLATFRGFEQTYTVVNTAQSQHTLYANWTQLDGEIPLDLSGKDLSQCYLQMNVHLTKSGTGEDDASLFRSGMIKLRSVDDPNEQNGYWWVGNLGLHTGDNAVSLRLSELTGGSGGTVTAINWGQVNRVLMYIDSVNTKVGTFSMTLSGVRIVEELPDGYPQAEMVTATQQMATFHGFEKTYTVVNTPQSQSTLYANWTPLDGGVPVDLSGVDGDQCYLKMTVRLTKSGTEEDDASLFRSGMIKLRSVDDPNEKNGYWWVGNLGLHTGENKLSLRLSDIQGGSNGTVTPIDLRKVNRVLMYIDSVNTKLGTFSMTLSDVRIEAAERAVVHYNAFARGADRSGRDDCTAVIQQCLNLAGQTGGTVYLPAGRYKVTGRLNVPGGVTLRGDWADPDTGGAGKGTILMAYADRGNAQPDATAFVSLHGASAFKNISVWYPEQTADAIAAYPPAISGDGHTVVEKVTLYNAYRGFYSTHCSSMLIRDFYATALAEGIYAEKGYDIPRIERVRIDSSYWIDSGLPGAPAGGAAQTLVNHLRTNAVGIAGGQQDWGYWYDIRLNDLKWGVRLFHGNISVGKLVTTNVQTGIHIDKISYPGLEVSHSDISASFAGIDYAVTGRETLSISDTVFRGGDYGIRTSGVAQHGVSLHSCTFTSWNTRAIEMDGGSLNASRCTFQADKTALGLGAAVDQLVLTGNTFVKADNILSGSGWSNTDSRLVRDDANRDVPASPTFAYTPVPVRQPRTSQLFNAADYGATVGGSADATAAIQAALNAAGQAGGGTVCLPAGILRVNGSLSVPAGVELRGSFEAAHYGNSTNRGTQLYAYGNKDNPNGAPLITLAAGAGVTGFTVFYPEQGYSDLGLTDAERVHAYPPTIRADAGDWIQDLAIIAGYTGIDAMTNRCDGIVIEDVTGATLKECLAIGHGIRGGWVQDFHFNYSGWGQQGFYPNYPADQLTADGVTTRTDLLCEYTTREVTGITLGECHDVQFFSDFNILVGTQLRLIPDPYTGGSFDGTMWGVAFDACQYGVVGENDCDAQLTLLSSMGVFNQQGGGYNIVTKPGFTGTISMFNADAWSGYSKLAYVEGGTVNLVHYFSWCAYYATAKAGGTLNVLGSTFISASNNDQGLIPHVVYESGSQGICIGNLDCRKQLHLDIAFGAQVDERLNGIKLANSQPQTLASFTAAESTYTVTNTASGKGILYADWKTLDGGVPLDLSGHDRGKVYLQLKVTLAKSGTTAGDGQLFRSGAIKLRSAIDNPEHNNRWGLYDLNLHTGDNYLTLRLSESISGANGSTVEAIDWSCVNRFLMYIDSVNQYEGTFSMTLSDIDVVYRPV
ncbi:MAG: glycosyl hydrolase family 28-related protein [Acutalibacteraceae bacterium]|jgi:polygalacturonase